MTLDHVGGSAGTYTILDAGTLTGAENLTDTIVTLLGQLGKNLVAMVGATAAAPALLSPSYDRPDVSAPSPRIATTL